MFGFRTRADKATAHDAPVGSGASAWRGRLWPNDRFGRIWRASAAVLFACGLAAAVAPWTVSRGALREEIAAQLRSSSGLYVFTEGRSTFSLLPHPHVRLEKINFVEPRAAMVIMAEQLSGQVRILPLLAGRLELYRAELLRPKLIVDIDARPMTTAGAAVRAADAKPASPEAAKADRARLGVVSLVDGAAELRRNGTTIDSLENINATLDWRTVASPAALDGEATWRGQRGSVSLWVGRPSDMLRGDNSRMTLQIKSPGLSFSANGTVAAGQRPHFQGRVVATTDSLRETLQTLRVAVPLPVALGRASIDATADAGAKGVDLADVRLKLNSSSFEGALAVRADDERPILSGTLATSILDLSELFRYVSPLIGRDGHFSQEPIVWRDRDSFDLDLRLSAARAVYERVQARDLAGAVLLRDGRLDASLADASMYKGAVKARLVVSPSDKAGLDMKCNIEARGLDWGALGWDRFGESHVSGLANLHLSIDGTGGSFDQIARSLNGHGDMELTKGDIAGIDVERVLRRIDKRPLATVMNIHSGRTPFASASVSTEIANGVATVADATARGDGYALALAGTAQIAERQMALHATVAASDGAGEPRPDGPGFAFDIQGSWDNPSIVPDASSFIRRSGAARMLFAPRKTDEPAQ